MGCNCGGRGKKNQIFVYSFHGVVKEYKTEVEARAAQIRNGGGVITTKAA